MPGLVVSFGQLLGFTLFCLSSMGGTCFCVFVLPSPNFPSEFTTAKWWGKPSQNHVDKRILGGKGLQYEDSTRTTFVRPVYPNQRKFS